MGHGTGRGRRRATPLDDVEFLVRSDHRVTVLRTLAAGPRTRATLHAETGVSQPTLGRVLGDFTERNWVERRGREYALTPTGRLIADGLETLCGTVATVQRLGDVLVDLPTDEMGFDLRAFATARVTRPEDGNAFAPVDRLSTVFYAADQGRIAADTVPPGTPEDHESRAARFTASDQRRESINSTRSLERVLADERTADLFREGVFGTGRVDVYEYDGAIPCILAVADGTALLAPTDEGGVPVALVETDDETVRAWVESRLDAYRDASTLVTAERLDA